MSGATKLMTPGGGGVNLTPASSIASDVTVQVPSQNCTLGIQGPAFGAYMSAANQSIATGTWTKVAFDTKIFDTATNYNTSTYRFTPTVAGYYQINAGITCNTNSTGRLLCSIYKNGSEYFRPFNTALSTPNEAKSSGGALIYMNGSADYLEVYAYQSSGITLNLNGSDTVTSQWSGALVRSA